MSNTECCSACTIFAVGGGCGIYFGDAVGGMRIDNIELRNAISSAYNSLEQVKLTQEVHYFNMKTRIADYFIEHANYSDMMHPTSNFGEGIVFSNLTLSASATITQKINACQSSIKEMKQLKERLIRFKKNEL